MLLPLIALFGLLAFLISTIQPTDIFSTIALSINITIIITFLILIYPKKKTREYFMELIKAKNAKELVKRATSFNLTTNLALYALVDIRYPSTEEVFSAYLKKKPVKGTTSTVMNKLKLRKLYPYDEPDYTNTHSDYTIEVTEVYFVN